MRAIITAALWTCAASASGAAPDLSVRDAVETVDGEKLEYFEASPARVGARLPAVLLFHHHLEGVDEYVKGEARRLAELGYLVVAPKLAASDDVDGVKDGRDLSGPLHERYLRLIAARSKAALQLLQRGDRVLKDKIAIVGLCHLGGVAAMNAARTGAEVAGVATLWGGVSPKDMSTAWSRRSVKPKILVLLGGKDVETNPYLASFQEEMRQGKADWRMIVYGTASHAFTIPGPHPGGRGEYDPAAARLAHRDLSHFLQDLFGS